MCMGDWLISSKRDLKTTDTYSYYSKFLSVTDSFSSAPKDFSRGIFLLLVSVHTSLDQSYYMLPFVLVIPSALERVVGVLREL